MLLVSIISDSIIWNSMKSGYPPFSNCLTLPRSALVFSFIPWHFHGPPTGLGVLDAKGSFGEVINHLFLDQILWFLTKWILTLWVFPLKSFTILRQKQIKHFFQCPFNGEWKAMKNISKEIFCVKYKLLNMVFLIECVTVKNEVHPI